MNSLRLFDRRVGFAIVAAVLLLTTVVSAIASAAQLTERSIALSSSSVLAKDVTYTVKFTSVDEAAAFVVDFCSNSPVIGQACTAPADFDVTNVASVTPDFTDVADLSANTVRVTGAIAADEEITVALDNIDNPSVVGPIYARIVTYDTAVNANLYTAINADDNGSGKVDDGGAAISINNTIGVSGAVLESMTFCVSKNEIEEDCTNVETPVLALGEEVGDVVALTPEALSTGSIWTQISTNADGGAVISLKSNAEGCGGLIRSSAPTACDIEPAFNTGITAGQAKFGVRTSAATDAIDAENTTGALQPVTGSIYNDTTFAFNYILGDATGVTSTFGDPFLDTDGNPVNNKNMQLVFGASISNDTPAGLYSVDLGLIATGKF